MAAISGKDKIKGMFLGVAIGDALFMPVETWSAEEIVAKYGRITAYKRPDGHKWYDGCAAGVWTDDTQLTLEIAESLIMYKKIDMDDIARRHVLALRETGGKGWGGSTREAVRRLEAGVGWHESGTHANPKRGCGNGLPMKITPVGAYWHARGISPDSTPSLAIGESGKILWLAAMTHKTAMAYESAMAHVLAVRYCLDCGSGDFSRNGFLHSVLTASLFAQHQYQFDDLPHRDRGRLIRRLTELAELNYEKITAAEISQKFDGGTCCVYNSLPFSYAFFLKNPRNIETLYDAGNAGGDTDTNASIVGGTVGRAERHGYFPGPSD